MSTLRLVSLSLEVNIPLDVSSSTVVSTVQPILVPLTSLYIYILPTTSIQSVTRLSLNEYTSFSILIGIPHSDLIS